MTNELKEQTAELARLLRSTNEYGRYCAAADAALCDPASKALLTEYRKLQLKVQAAELSGSQEFYESAERLQRLGELLHMNPATSEFLLAQFSLNSLIADIYKTIASAVDADFGIFDD